MHKGAAMAVTETLQHQYIIQTELISFNFFLILQYTIFTKYTCVNPTDSIHAPTQGRATPMLGRAQPAYQAAGHPLLSLFGLVLDILSS